MKDLKKKVSSLPTRTPFQKVIKEAVLSLYENKAPELKNPLDQNKKSDLVDYAEHYDIEVGGDKNKPDYIEAIKEYQES